jgi:hypothetical protein
MQKTRRTAAAATLSAVLVAGTVAGFMLMGGTAKAAASGGSCPLGAPTGGTVVTSCAIPTQVTGSTTPATVTLTAPENIWIEASASNPVTGGDPVIFGWTISCTDSSGTDSTPAKTDPLDVTSTTGALETYIPFPDGMSDAESCAVTVTAADATVVAGDQITVTLEYNEGTTATATATTASPTPSATKSTSAPPVTVHQVHGFYGTCVDDFGNSSAERTKIGIWTCSPTDTAQSWSYSGDELHIHGMCVNAKGTGKSGSKLILWKCTGAANEIFVHNSKQEYVEKTNGWKYCIDDPGYSKKNGTQLFVYSCNNGSNQHFSLP